MWLVVDAMAELLGEMKPGKYAKLQVLWYRGIVVSLVHVQMRAVFHLSMQIDARQ